MHHNTPRDRRALVWFLISITGEYTRPPEQRTASSHLTAVRIRAAHKKWRKTGGDLPELRAALAEQMRDCIQRAHDITTLIPTGVFSHHAALTLITLYVHTARNLATTIRALETEFAHPPLTPHPQPRTLSGHEPDEHADDPDAP
ncbi:hypothetical protein [Nocardia terpenica]|uniref:Uncharacterized protein n=1 Tax=Nocardia terpenica TaxID=455432 RepID=A0A6G9ZE36_9NOCA|nr:hypothetical protein [Nocardia terpenica]QIS23671.1 hypothetical protein F6W96_40765 [Nocardia terpenica]